MWRSNCTPFIFQASFDSSNIQLPMTITIWLTMIAIHSWPNQDRLYTVNQHRDIAVKIEWTQMPIHRPMISSWSYWKPDGLSSILSIINSNFSLTLRVFVIRSSATYRKSNIFHITYILGIPFITFYASSIFMCQTINMKSCLYPLLKNKSRD